MTNAEATATEATATVTEQGAPGAATKAASKKGALKSQKTAKGGKAKTTPNKEVAPARKTTKAQTHRPESKGTKILDMIARPEGASLDKLMKATDWQAHSVRGFLSNAAKKQGIEIVSTKNEDGERIYRSQK